MQKSKQYIIWGLLLFLLGGGVYYFLKEEQMPQPKEKETVATDTAQMTYLGNTIREEKDGKPIWEITAESIQVVNETQQLKINGLQATFYQADGGQTKLAAPTGIYDTKTKQLRVEGGIQAKHSDGAVLEARELQWDGVQQLLRGSGQVRLARQDTVVEGDRLETDAGLLHIRVQGNAKVVKGVKENE